MKFLRDRGIAEVTQKCIGYMASVKALEALADHIHGLTPATKTLLVSPTSYPGSPRVKIVINIEPWHRA